MCNACKGMFINSHGVTIISLKLELINEVTAI